MLSVDFAILNFIRDNCSAAWLDVLMPLITRLGNSGAVWIALALRPETPENRFCPVLRAGA